MFRRVESHRCSIFSCSHYLPCLELGPKATSLVRSIPFWMVETDDWKPRRKNVLFAIDHYQTKCGKNLE